MSMTSLLSCHWRLPLLTSVLLIGCSHQPPLYEVTGLVTFDGQPIPEGDLLFITPDGTRGPDPAKITGGKYELKTTAGKKRVEISASKIRPGGARGAGGEPVAEEYVPARYNIQSELTADVQAKAKNTFDFELGSK
jgi:hypothetical protein